MPKLYKVEGARSIIKITTVGIIEFDFFRCNGSTYKDTIEAVYTLEMPVNLISIGKLQFDSIIYNKFNYVIIIESIR